MVRAARAGLVSAVGCQASHDMRRYALFVLAMASLHTPAQEVGEIGVVARLEAVGNQAIPTEDLRRALLGDLDWLLASHPRAPLEQLLRVASERISAGYQASGFPHAAVTAKVAAGHLRVDIVEGRRFRCGTVVVTGATVIPAATVTAWLTTAQPKAKPWTAPQLQAELEADKSAAAVKRMGDIAPDELVDPLWRPGRPADFTATFAQRLAAQVRANYAQAGRLAASATIAVKDGADGTADLHMTISDEGVIARVAEVTVTGLERTPRAEFDRALGVTPDMALDQDTTQRLEVALSDCGRFRYQQVTLEPTDDRTRYRVAVTVQESGNIPPLPQALSPEAKALLAARTWLLADLNGGPEDLVLTADKAGASYAVVLSPRNGLLVSYDVTPTDGKRRHGGLLIGTDSYQVVSGNAGRGVRGTMRARFGMQISLTNTSSAQRQKPTNRDPLSFTVQLPFTVKGVGDVAPSFAMQVTAAPATLLTIAYADDQRWRLTDGRLTLADAPVGSLAIDAASGRPLPIDHTDDKGFHLTAGFAAEAFATHLAAFTARHATVAWTSDPEAPLSAITALLLDEIREVLPLAAQASGENAGALVELADVLTLLDAAGADGLLPRAEVWLREALANLSKPDAFWIPPAPGFQLNLQSMTAITLAKFSGLLSGDMPADGWPLALLRGTAGVLIGNTTLINPDLRILTADNGCGPFGCLALAGAMRLINPGSASYFAKLGSDRLGEAHLLRDARLFRPWAGQILARLAELPVDAKLWDRLPADQRTAIRDLLTTLRQPAGDAAAEAQRYDDACRVLWANGLRQRVAGWLSVLAPEDAAPIP